MSKKELLWNILVTLLSLTGATIVSYLLVFVGGHTANVSIVYMMAVVLISRFSNGYIPGVVASFISVICVNLVFTYPFMHLISPWRVIRNFYCPYGDIQHYKRYNHSFKASKTAYP